MDTQTVCVKDWDADSVATLLVASLFGWKPEKEDDMEEEVREELDELVFGAIVREDKEQEYRIRCTGCGGRGGGNGDTCPTCKGTGDEWVDATPLNKYFTVTGYIDGDGPTGLTHGEHVVADHKRSAGGHNEVEGEKVFLPWYWSKKRPSTRAQAQFYSKVMVFIHQAGRQQLYRAWAKWRKTYSSILRDRKLTRKQAWDIRQAFLSKGCK